MKQLIHAERAPIGSIGRSMVGLGGMPALGPVNMVMQNPLNRAEGKGEKDGRTHRQKRGDRQDGMKARMLRASQMQILSASGQHALALKKVVGKQMLYLQQDKQDQSCL